CRTSAGSPARRCGTSRRCPRWSRRPPPRRPRRRRRPPPSRPRPRPSRRCPVPRLPRRRRLRPRPPRRAPRREASPGDAGGGCGVAVLIRLRYAALSLAIVAAGAAVSAVLATGSVRVGYAQASRPDAAAAPGSAPARQEDEVPARSAPGSPPRQLVVPDLFAVLPAGISAAQVSAIGGLAGV